jgi:hypothetical protein
VTAAMLLLGALLAQGPGAKAGGGGKKSAAPRSAEVQAKRSSSSAAASSPGGESNGGGGGGGDKAGGGGDDPARGTAAAGEGGSGSGKSFKSKTYNFGAMDVEGKLKTPQLLYFLNRVKLELDMSAPDTRSFMKELEKSADDKNL